MARVRVGSVSAEQTDLGAEIARLRGLDIEGLRARWRSVYRRKPPPHLPRHLLYRILAYRLQAEHFGDLSAEIQRLLDRAGDSGQPDRLAATLGQPDSKLRPGTILGREWKSDLHRVTVLAEGFAWGDKTFESLSKVAFAITGTRWNGPRFFGLRDKPANEGRS